MSKLEVDTIAPQSGTTITVGETGDTVDISNATLSANLNANNLTSGTIPDARFPATLPAVDGSNLTNVQIAGGYTVCDPITVTNTDTFALTSAGSPVSPESAANCIVSLNGVTQAPLTSYTISGSNIVFASALSAGSDVIDFITVLGTALNVGTVSDGTIGLNKLSATGTKDATTFLRGDNTFAAPSGGKILQVVQAVKNDTFSSASASWVDITGLSLSITPSSTSSRVFITTNFSSSHSAANSLGVKLVRDTTDIFIADDSDGGLRKYVTSWRYAGGASRQVTQSFQYVDSPSTTSATTYKLQIWATGGTAFINQMNVDSNNTTYGRSASSIIAFEIAG
jgi:hypothetical protein